MNVGEICSLRVRVCGPDQNLAEAGKILWEADCGSLPVVDADRKVLGVITDRDICLALCTRGSRASEVHVREVMSRRVIVCRADDPVSAAMTMMRKHQVRRLPVVDMDGRIEGMLSVHDILREADPYKGSGDADLKPDKAVLLMTAIGESPDLKATVKMPLPGGSKKPTTRRFRPANQKPPSTKMEKRGS